MPRGVVEKLATHDGFIQTMVRPKKRWESAKMQTKGGVSKYFGTSSLASPAFSIRLYDRPAASLRP